MTVSASLIFCHRQAAPLRTLDHVSGSRTEHIMRQRSVAGDAALSAGHVCEGLRGLRPARRRTPGRLQEYCGERLEHFPQQSLVVAWPRLLHEVQAMQFAIFSVPAWCLGPRWGKRWSYRRGRMQPKADPTCWLQRGGRIASHYGRDANCLFSSATARSSSLWLVALASCLTRLESLLTF